MGIISMSRKERKRLEAFSRVKLGGDDAGCGERLAGPELSSNEAGMVSVSERRRCRPRASIAWPDPKSTFAGGDETAVAGVVSPAVCRLRADIGGGMPGEGRRREGLGDNATAVAVAGRLVGTSAKATSTSSSSDAARASGRVGADGRFSSRLV